MSTGIVDFHVHSAPSLAQRYLSDPLTQPVLARLGVGSFVLKAHEGSTAERASLLGDGVDGGIVLNSPIGGANPDAVEVAARLGARIVWLPTSSSVAHQLQPAGEPGHEVHDSFRFAQVPVVEGGRLRAEWHDVFDVASRHGLILASGHLPIPETVVAFRAARRRGVDRFLVNHPLLPFMHWTADGAAELRQLEARIEIGVLADHFAGSVAGGTGQLLRDYPGELLVFGSDLGFTGYPDYENGYGWWMPQAERILGTASLDTILSANGYELLSR